jgi:general L-amino acid transport system permease protein
VFVVIVAVDWLATGVEISLPELNERNAAIGGLTMSGSMFAILFSLVIYTASHIAEIIRGSIQAVSKGQNEAANALALSGYHRMRYVILPQAFRIALPPLGNQYLNLTKNSTLGGVVAFPELAQVTSISVANSAPPVPSWLLTLLIFLILSLIISAIVNLFNRRLALVTR